MTNERRQIEGQMAFDDLPTWPAARSGDPLTSHAVARLPGRGTNKRKVLVALRKLVNGTDEDIAAKAGLEKGIAARRRLDLQREGFVQPYVHWWDAETGEPKPYLAHTRSGCLAQVWAPTTAGWEADLSE